VRNPAAHGKAIFVLPGGGRAGAPLLLKIARGGAALPFMRNEVQAVERVRNLLPGPWEGSLPRILVAGDHAGRHVIVQEYVPGASLARRPSARRLETGLRWLDVFYRATAHEVVADHAVLEGSILAPLREYGSRFGEADAVARAVEYVSTLYAGRTISLTARHGDFWPGNLLLRGGQPVVIDWDFARFDALPFFDYFYYLGTNRWLETGGTFADAFRDVPERFRARITADLEGPFGHLGFVPGDAEILYLLFVVEACLQQHDRLLDDEANGFLAFSPGLEGEEADYREKMAGEFFRGLAAERLSEI
jgi:hypothetical protein